MELLLEDREVRAQAAARRASAGRSRPRAHRTERLPRGRRRIMSACGRCRPGTVTLLFTDVEGSTRLLDELGADAYAAALQEHRRRAARRVRRPRRGGGRHAGRRVLLRLPGGVGRARSRSRGTGGSRRRADPRAHGPAHRRAEADRRGLRRARRPPRGPDRRVRSRRAGARVGGDGGAARGRGAAGSRRARLKDLSAPERIFQLGDGEFPPLKSLYRTNLPIPATRSSAAAASWPAWSALLARPTSASSR